MKIARFSSKGEDPRYGILDERHLVVLAGDPMYQGFETTGSASHSPTPSSSPPSSRGRRWSGWGSTTSSTPRRWTSAPATTRWCSSSRTPR
ncbi:DUF2437 domain-containing protein [Sphingomonas sp. LR61]|uniref:DUF2437 domain-containing protein n=1 Tax=Sphingomonas sp. LR61 TaxID=3050234 RepID=UPI003FA79CEC